MNTPNGLLVITKIANEIDCQSSSKELGSGWPRDWEDWDDWDQWGNCNDD